MTNDSMNEKNTLNKSCLTIRNCRNSSGLGFIKSPAPKLASPDMNDLTNNLGEAARGKIDREHQGTINGYPSTPTQKKVSMRFL